MRIVRFLGFRSPMGAQVREVARECDLPLGTAHRLLQCLLIEGMVLREHPPSKLYKLGPLALGLGTDGSHHHFDGIAAAVGPLLNTLAADLTCLAELVVRVGRYGVCAARINAGAAEMADVIRPGESALLGYGAVSIALLSALPATASEEILWDNRWTTRRSGIETNALTAAVERARDQGYAYSDKLFLPDVTCVAMCIPNNQDFSSAAIGLYFNASHLNAVSLRRVAKDLHRVTATVATAIAGSHSFQDPHRRRNGLLSVRT